MTAISLINQYYMTNQDKVLTNYMYISSKYNLKLFEHNSYCEKLETV